MLAVADDKRLAPENPYDAIVPDLVLPTVNGDVDRRTVDRPRSRRFIRIAELGIAIGLAFLAMSNRAQLAAAFAGFTRVAMRPALAGVGLSITAMANRGQLNRAAYRAAGMNIGSFAMTRTSAVGFAANKVVKSGGAAGLSVFVRDGRRRGLPSGKVAASCVLAAGASFAALGVLLAATVILLAFAVKHRVGVA